MWRSPKTMRSAAQLATWCWLDEEVRLGGVRNDGVITNMMDPLGRHIWPSNSIQIPMNDSDSSSSNATAATHTDASKSIAISRLSAAILHSRFSNNIPMGNVPGNMRKLVLEKDMRYGTSTFSFTLFHFSSFLLHLIICRYRATYFFFIFLPHPDFLIFPSSLLSSSSLPPSLPHFVLFPPSFHPLPFFPPSFSPTIHFSFFPDIIIFIEVS